MNPPPPDPEPIASDKPTLEIQHLREQVGNSRLETATLRESIKWNRRVGRYLPLATVIVALVGLWLSVCQFNAGRRDAVMREVARPFWENQLEIYVQAATAAAKIATEPDPAKSAAAQATFWKLYWGPMGCVEDVTLASASTGKSSKVEAAMVAFGNELLGPSTPAEKSGSTPIIIRSIDNELSRKLKPLALQIAHAMREQLTPSFELGIAPTPTDKNLRKVDPIAATPAAAP